MLCKAKPKILEAVTLRRSERTTESWQNANRKQSLFKKLIMCRKRKVASGLKSLTSELFLATE